MTGRIFPSSQVRFVFYCTSLSFLQLPCHCSTAVFLFFPTVSPIVSPHLSCHRLSTVRLSFDYCSAIVGLSFLPLLCHCYAIAVQSLCHCSAIVALSFSQLLCHRSAAVFLFFPIVSPRLPCLIQQALT